MCLAAIKVAPRRLLFNSFFSTMTSVIFQTLLPYALFARRCRDVSAIEAIEPVLVLGRLPTKGKKRKEAEEGEGSSIPGHTEAVLALHRNPHKA